jgi:hypothetical protein
MNVNQTTAPRANTARHIEIAWGLAPTARLPIPIPPARPVKLPVVGENRSEFSVEWLDTPATHCSPLDDY